MHGKELIEKVRDLFQEEKFDLAISIIVSGGEATVINASQSQNTRESLIMSLLLISDLLKDQTKGSLNKALDRVQSLVNDTELVNSRVRH